MPSGDLNSLLNPTGRPILTPPTSLTIDDGRSTIDSARSSIVYRPSSSDSPAEIHGTTVIAVKYRDGVINVGDRRATANFAVMYDRAEKVLPIDDYTLMAISGSFARAMEVVRYLRTQFRYFERSQLQPMSLDGKLSEVAKVIAAGVPAALQGIGGVIPILSMYDLKTREGRIFFYDGMGARFESTEFGAAGSGSMQIRGVFDYIVKTKGPFREMTREDALREALMLLDIAADLDAATGGWSKQLPLAKTITADGIADVTVKELREIVSGIDKQSRKT